MLKSDLRERAYSEIEITPGKLRITLIWVLLTAAIIVLTFIIRLVFVGYVPSGGAKDDVPLFGAVLEVPAPDTLLFIIAIVGSVFMYLFLKLIVTIIFCRDKLRSIKLKFCSGTTMPVCACQEAFTIWQIVLIYGIPAVIIYALFLIAVLSYTPGFTMITALFFLMFFISFDLTLIVYVLVYKIKNGADYISIENHVYSMTLFNKQNIFVRRKKKKLHKLRKLHKTKFK